MKRAPEVAVIQDLSGFGRCSATIALPVLAAMGNRCETLLTAYLSAHTAYPSSDRAVFLDLTEEMTRCSDHWLQLGASFEAIYSGFLGSERQIDVLRAFIARFRRPNTLVLVDPVMGDHGKPYSTYTRALCQRMGALAEQADIITPNLTEAALLLEEPYEAVPSGEAGMAAWLERLSLGGRRSVVITGVSLSDGEVGAGCWDRETGRVSFSQARQEPAICLPVCCGEACSKALRSPRARSGRSPSYRPAPPPPWNWARPFWTEYSLNLCSACSWTKCQIKPAARRTTVLRAAFHFIRPDQV